MVAEAWRHQMVVGMDIPAAGDPTPPPLPTLGACTVPSWLHNHEAISTVHVASRNLCFPVDGLATIGSETSWCGVYSRSQRNQTSIISSYVCVVYKSPGFNEQADWPYLYKIQLTLDNCVFLWFIRHLCFFFGKISGSISDLFRILFWGAFY